ncbi:nuclear transport factor 2 family protein [Nocardia sp. NBC_01377]|uniref:nuclear transport factor 2 family protein n=1 Tax=Nocardia sp. NBC_01377 TaxID=2903595 RepID=UPI0032561C99
MNEKQVVTQFWAAMEARDWERLRSCLDGEFRAFWPQSGEKFDVDGFIRVNRAYPGDWHVRIVSFVLSVENVVTEVDVDIGNRTDRAVSFFVVRSGKILNLREFWPDPFPVPEWRRTLMASQP